MRRTSFVLLSILLLCLLPSGLNFGGASSGSYYFNFDIAVTPVAPSTHDTTNVTVSFDTNYIYENPASFSPLSRIGNNFSIVIEIYPWPHMVPVCGYEEETYNLGNLSVGLYYFNVDVEVWSGLPGDIFRMPLDSAVYNQSFTIDTLTITVPDDYTTIQEAINAAGEGDTIFVRNGTYDEHVVVDKSVTVVGDSGGPVVNGAGSGDLFHVTANEVTIRGFALASATNGVYLAGSNGSQVCNNLIEDVLIGAIVLEASCSNLVEANVVDGFPAIGIAVVWGSKDNVVRGNEVVGCHDYGINIVADNNLVIDNLLVDNEAAFDVVGTNNVIYYNNAVGNAVQVIGGEFNVWDNGCEGNYWSDYQDRYPNASYDRYGIWDASYVIDAETVDRYPLRNPYWNIADLNHDLKVDVFDLVCMCACYCLDWQEHMCHVDVAEPYGVIDIFDVVAVAINYGKQYTP